MQVALTSATDTSELLGSFEQSDPVQTVEVMQRRLDTAARAVIATAAAGGYVDEAADAAAAWEASTSSPPAAGFAQDAQFQNVCAKLASTATLMGPAAVSVWTAAVQAYIAALDALAGAPQQGGGFVWVDGVLLEAMASGDWLLLDNVNLCSPTVLDRLNPLLEPGGDLLIPEAGSVRGAPRRAVPSPGFRLLLALDPRHGEVSRAMRNRGVEVFIAPTQLAATQVRCPALGCATAASCKDFHPLARGTFAFGDDGCTWERGHTLRTTKTTQRSGRSVRHEASTAMCRLAVRLCVSTCMWCCRPRCTQTSQLGYSVFRPTTHSRARAVCRCRAPPGACSLSLAMGALIPKWAA